MNYGTNSVLRALPRALLVDLDDTIIDGSAVEDCWEVACRCCPPEVKPAVVAEIARLRDWYWSDPVRHREGRLDLSAARRRIAGMALDNVGCHTPPGLADRIAELYDQCREERTSVFPGAVDVLNWLRQRGCRLALVTNGAAAMQRQKIERFQLEPLFDAILVEGELGFGKPDERIYHLALNQLAVTARDSWMIGDNLEWDVEQPQKLGITGIWVDRTGAGVPASRKVQPDLILKGFADLRANIDP